MRVKLGMKIALVCLLLFSLSLSAYSKQEAQAFSPQVIQKGAVGDDVIELQSRLQYIGFYKGKIDGVFGWGTYWALRNFQEKFGLTVDGMAGQTTKDKLVAASKYNKNYVKKNLNQGKEFTHYGGKPLDQQVKQGGNNNKSKGTTTPKQTPGKPTAVNIPQGFSQNDIQLLANAVYGEARGEPYIGQVAVAAVILNRIQSPSFPNTVAGVIFEPLAFTAVADGQIWLTPNDQAKKAVIDAINGWDPTGNALYYFNPVTSTSKWIWSRPQIKTIGKHIFAK